MRPQSPNLLLAAVLLLMTRLASHPVLAASDPLAGNLPEAAAVTRRMVERAQTVAQNPRSSSASYDKRTLFEHLDAAGRTTKSEEKLHHVTLVAGLPISRLVKVQGRDLSSEELKKEQAKEERLRQKFTSADARKMATRKEAVVTAQLLDRYQFTVKERVLLNGRPTLLLTFKPKEGRLPGKTFLDKVLNHQAGTLWVDEAEAEPARVTTRLTESVSLGIFGVLGSLYHCELSLDRHRSEDGVWFNGKQVLLIHCRKVASALRFRITEESSGFKSGPAHP